MTKTAKLSPWAELKLILREILRVLKETSAHDRISYSVPELAARMGVSDQQIYDHIAVGDVEARYSGGKKVILVEEADRFAHSLPTESRGSLR